MNIYVGRWDLLPDEWEGINGLYEKSEEEIAKEVYRQVAKIVAHGDLDANIGRYADKEFEEFFNGQLQDNISSVDYWIKFF